MMPDREKVIKTLEYCTTSEDCRPCEYWQTFDDTGCQCMKDALALLKEQEAVKPRVSTAEQRCGHCNKVIEMDGWKVCPWCGKEIKWHDG